MAKRAKVKKRTAKKAAKKPVKKVGKKQLKLTPRDHDEPIVVDNGPVSISNRDAVVTLKSNGKKAERRFTKFETLVVEKTKNGMTVTDNFALDEDGSVTFFLFDPYTNKRDKIRVSRFGSPKKNVRLESNIDVFEFEDEQQKKLKMKGNSKARLTVIDAEGTDGPVTVILADDQNNFLFDSVKATLTAVRH